jgi:hypothetical protein
MLLANTRCHKTNRLSVHRSSSSSMASSSTISNTNVRSSATTTSRRVASQSRIQRRQPKSQSRRFSILCFCFFFFFFFCLLFSCRYRCNCWRWAARLIEQHQRQRRERARWLVSSLARRSSSWCVLHGESSRRQNEASSVANELDVDVVNSGRSATLLTRSSKVLLSIRSLRHVG